MPVNQDFVCLLESVQKHTELQKILLEQNTLMMQYLRALQQEQQPGDLPTQEHAEVAQQPRVWDTEQREPYPPTPTGSEHAKSPQRAPPSVQDLMPSPKRMPVSYVPGDQARNAILVMGEASVRSAAERQRRPRSATTPFRAGR